MTAGPAVAPPGRLAAAHFLLMAVVPTSVSLLPLRLQEMGIEDPIVLANWTGWSYAAGVGVSAVLTPIWGMLGDRVGPKWLLARGAAMLTLCCLGYSIATSPPMLLGLRALQGALSGVQPASYAMAAHLTSSQMHGRLFARLSSLSNLARLLGASGLIAASGLVGIVTTYYLLAILGAAGTAIVCTLPSNRWSDPRLARPERRSFAALMRSPRAMQVAPFLARAAGAGVRALCEQMLPLLLASRGVPLPTQGLWVGGASGAARGGEMLSAGSWRRQIERRGAGAAFTQALCLVAVCSLGVAADGHPAWTIASFAVLGIGACGLHLASVQQMTALLPGTPGTAVAIEASASRLGALVFTAGMGGLVVALGATGVCLGAAGLLAAAAWWQSASHGGSERAATTSSTEE